MGTETNRQTSSLCDKEYESLAHDDVERTLNTFSDIEMNNNELTTTAGEARTTESIGGSSVVTSVELKPCLLVPVKTHCKTKLTMTKSFKGERKSSSDDEHLNAVSTYNNPQTTCRSEVVRVTRSRSRGEENEISSKNTGNGLENVRMNMNCHYFRFQVFLSLVVSSSSNNFLL